MASKKNSFGTTLGTFPYNPSNQDSPLGRCMSNIGFLGIIDNFFLEKYKDEKIPRVILATYNRVGDGSFDGSISNPNFQISIRNGSLNFAHGEKNINKFLEETKKSLEMDMLYNQENPPLVILYGGSAESFNKVGKIIDELDAHAKLLGLEKNQRPKLYILSCSCDKEEKIKAVLPLIKDNRLEGLICENSEDLESGRGLCGGFQDMENIVKTIKNNYSGSQAVQ